MAELQPSQSKPLFDVIHEERTRLFAATCFTPEAAADEEGYTVDEVEFREEWYRPVRLTPAEVADDDKQHDLNPDWDEGDARVEWEFYGCKATDRDAIQFMRVVPKVSA